MARIAPEVTEALYAPWGTEVEVERRNRIRLSVWAYAYEMLDDPLVPDALFDETARSIRPQEATGHKRLDAFFATEFAPDTGMWIRQHPEQAKLFHLYHRMKGYLEND